MRGAPVLRRQQALGAFLLIGAISLPLAAATTAHVWRTIGRSFQIAEGDPEPVAITDEREGTRGSCPGGMVSVSGLMKTDGWVSVEALQKQACIEWINRDFPERCARFDREAWLALSQRLPVRPMTFCIDRFEFPNRRGAYPLVFVTWNEASAACAVAGKRLCTEDEWTFACEGEEAQPYPYGYERDAEACVIDRPYIEVDESMFAKGGEAVLREVDRLWQGEPSGATPGCRSPFGVYDTTGNVDEWTRSSRRGERPSILKGGYWGPVRTRCRPSTRAHGETYAYYQQGFRCCADPRDVAEPGDRSR